jgi:hypothetical protein
MRSAADADGGALGATRLARPSGDATLTVPHEIDQYCGATHEATDMEGAAQFVSPECNIPCR